MIVLDASAVADFLLARGELWDWLAGRLRGATSLHAPHLVDVEVASVVRGRALAGEISAGRGRAALDDLADLRLTRYPVTPLLTRIWELRANVTAYDGAYVALAEVLRAPLVTTDDRLGRSRGHRAAVDTFGA